MELLAIHEALHQVGAAHFANTGLQVAPRHILMHLARLQHGLLPNHAFPLYLRTRAGDWRSGSWFTFSSSGRSVTNPFGPVASTLALETM